MEPKLTDDPHIARIDQYVEAVRTALSSVPAAVQRSFVDTLLAGNCIVVAGRGRSGMIASTFARRLGHMGLAAWGLGDTTVPRLGSGDVMVACTGSGTTPTVLSLMETARSGGASVLAVTRAPARTGKVAHVTVELNVPSRSSTYPLGTLFEASLLAFLDQVVVDLLEATGATESDLGARHTNLE